MGIKVKLVMNVKDGHHI